MVAKEGHSTWEFQLCGIGGHEKSAEKMVWVISPFKFQENVDDHMVKEKRTYSEILWPYVTG